MQEILQVEKPWALQPILPCLTPHYFFIIYFFLKKATTNSSKVVPSIRSHEMTSCNFQVFSRLSLSYASTLPELVVGNIKYCQQTKRSRVYTPGQTYTWYIWWGEVPPGVSGTISNLWRIHTIFYRKNHWWKGWRHPWAFLLMLFTYFPHHKKWIQCRSPLDACTKMIKHQLTRHKIN